MLFRSGVFVFFLVNLTTASSAETITLAGRVAPALATASPSIGGDGAGGNGISQSNALEFQIAANVAHVLEVHLSEGCSLRRGRNTHTVPTRHSPMVAPHPVVVASRDQSGTVSSGDAPGRRFRLQINPGTSSWIIDATHRPAAEEAVPASGSFAPSCLDVEITVLPI